MLEDGNYRITFSLQNSTLGGTIDNPFGGSNQSLTHSYIVGTSTYVGAITETFLTDLDSIYSGLSATTTQALLDSCKPWDWGGFSILDCLSGLLLPDKGAIQDVMETFKSEIMTRAPWGYANRLFAIVSGMTTTTPPILTFSIPDDPYFDDTLRGLSVSFDPWNVVSEGSVLDSADGFGTGNFMDTVIPFWKIIIYGLMVIGMVHRIMGVTTQYTGGDLMVKGGQYSYENTNRRGTISSKRGGFL